jgi:hypothetical protein
MKKKGEIFQIKELNANQRIDEDFLKYSSDKNDNTEDNHCSDLVNPSPFLPFGYPIIKGFALVLVRVHAYTRPRRFRQSNHRSRLWKKEEKLDKNNLRKIDHRINLFAKCRPCEFERKPRILSSNARRYKHHEQRNMLLYYLFPVFKGILSKKKLKNLLLLQHLNLLMGGF